MADGYSVVVRWTMLRHVILGCTITHPIALTVIGAQRFAMTSVALLFVLVPEPV